MIIDETFLPIDSAPRNGVLIVNGHEDVGTFAMRWSGTMTNPVFAPGDRYVAGVRWQHDLARRPGRTAALEAAAGREREPALMAYRMPYKYTTFEEQSANGWKSRTAWKADGVNIPKGAKARGLGLRMSPKKLEYDLFAEEDGIRFRDRQIPVYDQDAMSAAFPLSDVF